MKPPPAFRTALLAGTLLLAGSNVPAATPRETFLAAKQTAIDANFRNDQTGLRAAIATFEGLATDPELGARARYHAAWTGWMLTASFLQDQKTPDAIAALESGITQLRRVLAADPDEPEAHALLGWMLQALVYTDRARMPELAPQFREHRQRALALAPHNPRAVMLDATSLLYSPQPEMQQQGLARWQETLALLAAEKVDDPTRPDWGRTLAEGWLANLYLFLKPPRVAEARALVEKALRERPDWWWAKTQVLPKTAVKP